MNRFKRNYNLNKSFDNYNKNPNQKYESEQNLMNPPISNIDLENSLNSCLLINQYINLNNKALNLLSKEQASKALSCYQKASSIANQLRDKFKIKESECNKGIAYYHLNDIFLYYLPYIAYISFHQVYISYQILQYIYCKNIKYIFLYNFFCS